jgi:hypothetical protein
MFNISLVSFNVNLMIVAGCRALGNRFYNLKMLIEKESEVTEEKITNHAISCNIILDPHMDFVLGRKRALSGIISNGVFYFFIDMIPRNWFI